MNYLSAILDNIVTIGIVIVFMITVILPKKFKYIVDGLLLTIVGGLNYLFFQQIIFIDIYKYPVFKYLISTLIIVCGKELIQEGSEEEGFLKTSSIILGLLLIIITIIPLLYSLNALTFMFNIPPMILSALYVLSGLFVIVGGFIFTD